jgi:hypothetical protein
MDETSRTEAGRDDNIGAAGADGYDTDIGGSHSGGSAGDVVKTGSGQTTPTAGSPFSEEEAKHADKPESGTPDDLKIGGGAGDPHPGDPSENS